MYSLGRPAGIGRREGGGDRRRGSGAVAAAIGLTRKWEVRSTEEEGKGITAFFLFLYFLKTFFTKIQFTVLYPYRRWRGGRQTGRPPGRGWHAPPNIKAEVPPHLHLQQTTSIEGKIRDVV